MGVPGPSTNAGGGTGCSPCQSQGVDPARRRQCPRSRQDRSDAEYGFGLDLGAGILWSDPQRGISGELKGRTLLSHGEEDFQGLALSFSLGARPLQPQTIPLPQPRHGRHCNG